MVVIGRVSKGSKMDQVYIPKNRIGLDIGRYVLISSFDEGKDSKIDKPYFYGVSNVGSLKIEIINKIFRAVENSVESYENIIVGGSFIDEGFDFNDIDVLIVSDDKLNVKIIEKMLERDIGAKIHVVFIDNKSLIEGMSSDPLYIMILSKCAARKRFVYRIKRKINYKILDFHLLKSKALVDGFDVLSGREKYKLTRNMIAISLFLKGKKVSLDLVDKEINKVFGLKDVREIKLNMLKKNDFLRRYKKVYEGTLNIVFRGIKDGAK